MLTAATACATVAALFASANPLSTLHPVAELHAVGQNDLPTGVLVENSINLRISAGEVQSTVVPPGKKWQCPYGRLLVSSDYAKDPAQVALIPLDDLSASASYAEFEDPLSWNYHRRIKSNDHDLVAYPNGDVLLVKMGQSKLPLFDETGQSYKPEWYDAAYKLSYDKDGNLTEAWGEGARSELLIWRSKDCGNNFDFVSSIDTATLDDDYGTPDDASAGNPQNSMETLPGKAQPAWQMGGTDGPLVRIDPKTNRVFVTIGVVGNKSFSPLGFFPYWVSNFPIERTVVMMSSDKGSTWSRAAVLPFSGWRVDVVPRSNDKLAIAHSGWDGEKGYAFVYPNRPIGFGILPFFDSPVYAAPEKTGQWGWNTKPWDRPVLYKKDQAADDYMKVNVHAQTVLTRSPSSNKLLMAYPDTIGTIGDGYRLYVHSGESTWLPMQNVAPESADPQNFALHLTAVDAGRGPLLLYWYDVDTNTKTAVMRGRLVTTDNQETIDFGVSRTWLGESSFDVTKDALFYGDYHTAGAYYVNVSGEDAYHYYPVWIESDGYVHVAHVSLNAPKVTVDGSLLGYLSQPNRERLMFREFVDLSRLAIVRTEEEEPPREPIRPEGR